MTKKQLVKMVAISTIVLGGIASGVASADEVSTASTVIGTTPTVVADTVTDGAGITTSNNVVVSDNTVNQTGNTSDTTIGSNTSTVTDTVTDGAGITTTDNTTVTDKPTEIEKPSDKQEETPISEEVTIQPVQPTQPEQPEIDYGNQSGQVSQVTGQEIVSVSYEQPVVTQSGYQVVDTVESVVTAVDTAGQTVVASAEDLGGQTNADGTVSFADAEGKMQTLPSTGEKRAWWSYLVGIVILGGAVYLGAKEKITAWIDRIRGIEYEEYEEEEE